MNVEVELLSRKDENEWQEFVRKHPNSCVYHTLEWSRVLESSFSFKNMSIIARKDGEIAGIMPLFLVKFPFLGKKLISIPFDTEFGGCLCYNNEIARVMVDFSKSIARKHGVKYLEIRSANELPYCHDFVRKNPVYHTHLTLTSIEDNWNRIKKNHRVAVKQSQKRGVKTFVTEEKEYLNILYKEFLKFFRSVASPFYPKRFFLHIHKLGMLKLVIAEYDEDVIGGSILLYFKDKVIYRFGVAKEEYLKLRPYNAIIWKCIEWAIQNGFRLMTFGYTYPSQKGLLKFKEGWGCVSKKSNHYYYTVNGTIPNFEKQYGKFIFIRRMYKRLPLAVIQPLGGVVRRWVC